MSYICDAFRIVLLDGLITKLVIDSDPHNALVEFDRNVGDQRWSDCVLNRAIRRAGPVAKVDKEIFSLSTPMRGNCDFDAGAGGPAGFGRTANRIVGKVRLDIAEGGAPGAVDEKALESIAGAAARCGKPSILCQAPPGAEAGGTGGGKGAEAAGVGPVAIGLNAEHPGASLVIGTKRSSEYKTGGVENVA